MAASHSPAISLPGRARRPASSDAYKGLKGLNPGPTSVGDLRVFYDVTKRAVHVLAIVSKSDSARWLSEEGEEMRKIALSEAKDDLSRVLRLAETEEIVITRHGRPAGVLIGFANEDDWFDYRLENDPRFLARVEAARASLRAGRGVKLEDVEE